MERSEQSKNDYAAQIVGRRDETGRTIVSRPAWAMGYRCPKCRYRPVVEGKHDQRLSYSEYEGFLWCKECNFDYPTCICLPDDPETATNLYLTSVNAAIERAIIYLESKWAQESNEEVIAHKPIPQAIPEELSDFPPAAMLIRVFDPENMKAQVGENRTENYPAQG